MTVRNDSVEMRVTVFTARSQTSKKFTRQKACMRFIQKQVHLGNRVRFEMRPVGDWTDRTELLQGVPSHLKNPRFNVGHLGVRPADTVISWCRRNLEHKEQLPAEADLVGYTNCTLSQVRDALGEMEHFRNLIKPLPSYIGVPQRYIWLGSR
jgi:hypothetical protein